MPTRARAYQGRVRVEEFGFETLADYQDWRGLGRRAVRGAWDRKHFLLWVTGNHLGTLPVYDELASSPDAVVIQFDGHLDVYNLTDCTEELSHGNFLLHCAGPLPPILNIGHRELLLRPEYLGKYYRRTFSAAEVAVDPGPAWRRCGRRSPGPAGSLSTSTATCSTRPFCRGWRTRCRSV